MSHPVDPRSIDVRAFGVPETDPEVAAAEQAQRLAEDCARALWRGDAASQALGMRLDEIGPGRAVVQMRVRADMLDGQGGCHGGLIVALAESAFAYARNSRDRASRAAACQVDFLAAARDGELLLAEAEERALAGRSGYYDVTVRTADGVVVALLRGRSDAVHGTVIAPAAG